MDYKTFLTLLSQQAPGKADVETKVDALIDTIRQICTDQDTMAVPAFGSFTGLKKDEKIVVKDGVRQLLPPKIEVLFRPSVILRKRITSSQDE